jgi:PAS domain S-box-containing protein
MDQLDFNRLASEIVSGAADAIVYADREGVIRLWNRGAEELFGVPAAEAVGRSLDLVIPEKQRARHWEGWRQVMETGVTRYGKDVLAVPATHRDGRRLSIEFTVQLLRDGAGRVTGCGAIMRDVTARFEKDRALKARLRELEAKVGAT